MIVVAVLSSKRPFHECILTWVFYRRYNTSGFMSNDGIYRRSRLARQARLNYNLVHPPPSLLAQRQRGCSILTARDKFKPATSNYDFIPRLSPPSPVFFFFVNYNPVNVILEQSK